MMSSRGCWVREVIQHPRVDCHWNENKGSNSQQRFLQLNENKASKDSEPLSIFAI